MGRVVVLPPHRLKIRQTIKNSNNEDEVSYISPSAVKDIFKRISPEDARFLGFDYPEIKPEYMILSVIPVPANALSHR